MISDSSRRLKRSRGFTLIELLIVMGIAVILLVIALPTMSYQRRLMRFNGVTREFLTQLRYARQLAMSERQAITFQYDDTNKVINIIDHNNDPTNPTSGTAVLAETGYPNTTSPAAIVYTVSLLQGGLQSGEIKYGVPTGTADGLPTGHATLPTSLGDTISMTTLPTSKKLNITFQADGSVISPAGVPTGGVTLSAGTRLDSAIFLFDNVAATATPTAISVLGASGRVKVWRYNDSANTFNE